jgi:hypothetical protein
VTGPASAVQTRPKHRGQKRRFGLAGLVNVILTNIILQALLASSFLTVATATFISQLFNGVLGYSLYGKLFFRANGLRSAPPLLRYTIMMALLWGSNTVGILAAQRLGIGRHAGALVMIPVLAAISYGLQNKWVFPAA